MRKLFIFALSLFLVSCQEVTIPNPKRYILMNISDALPVQFWLQECDTFNENEAQGVHHVCWCQPWNCDDEIKLQFTNESNIDLYLLMVASDGTFIDTANFTKTFNGSLYVYDLTLIPSDYSICDQQVKLLLSSADPQNSIDDSLDSYSGWSNQGSGTEDWNIPTFGTYSKFLSSGVIDPTIAQGTEVVIDVFVTSFKGATDTTNIKGYLFKDSNPSDRQEINFGNLANSLGLNSLSETVVADDDYDRFEILATFTRVDNTLNATATINAGLQSPAINATPLEPLDNPEFDVSIDPWANTNLGRKDWTWNSGNVEIDLTTVTDLISEYLFQELDATIPAGSVFEILLNCESAGTPPTLTYACFSDDGITWEEFLLQTSSPGGELDNRTATLTNDANFFALKCERGGSVPGTVGLSIVDVSLLIVQEYDVPDASTWTNRGAGLSWSSRVVSAPRQFSTNLFALGTTSDELRKAFVASSGQEVNVAMEVSTENEGGNGEVTFTVRFKNGGSTVDSEVLTVKESEGTKNISFSKTLSGNITHVSITANNSGTSSNVKLSVHSINVFFLNELGKSDCLDVQESHDETILIEYSNERNFAGLIYEDASPDKTFNIRVPSRFIHEEFQQEVDAIELTSSIITTRSQKKKQRLLEVKHAPYYFHNKLIEVLQHQSVTIFDKLWKNENAYTLNKGNMRWPLKSATVLLTQGTSVVRNVL